MKKIIKNISLLMKYNKLKNKLETKQDEYDKKVLELYTERKIHKKEKEIWENKLNEQLEEIIDLKQKLKKKKLKKEV